MVLDSYRLIEAKHEFCVWTTIAFVEYSQQYYQLLCIQGIVQDKEWMTLDHSEKEINNMGKNMINNKEKIILRFANYFGFYFSLAEAWSTIINF